MHAPARLAAVLALSAGVASAQPAGEFPPPKVKLRAAAVRASSPLDVDGRLDEAEWERATPLSPFVMVEPEQGAKPTLPTTVRVLFDEQALYIGARCDDPAGRSGIQQRDLRRDFDLEASDAFGVTFDTLGDGRNAFGFFVNPYGAQLDLQVIDDQLYEANWDTVWSSGVRRDDAGWTVELAIPWKSLRTEKGRTEWGFQVSRRTRRVNEQSVWSPVPRGFSEFRMPYAGVLEGLQPPQRTLLNLQLRPYGILRTGREGDGAFGAEPSAGGEVTWAPTEGSVVDLTFNTDFAETDVDRRVVNLGRFSVFFPERRQFFLESAGLFSTGVEGFFSPFFSRTIGLADGRRVPITAGGRFVLRSTERSVGALVVNTAATPDGAGGLFGVARYSQNVGEQSRLGGMLVTRHDFSGPSTLPSTNLVPVVDGMFRAGPFTFNAMASGSLTQTYDGRAPGLGGAASAQAAVQGNWGGFGAAAAGLSPGYEARAGFVSREEVFATSAWWYLDVRPKWLPSFIRSLHQYGEVYGVWSSRDGTFQEASAYLEPLWFKTPGGDKAWLFGQHSWQTLTEPFAPVPGVEVPAGRYEFDQVGVVAFSEQSRVVSFNGSVVGGRYFHAGYLRAHAALAVQPIPHVSVLGRYEYNRFQGEGVQPGGAETHLLLGEARLAVSPRLQLIGSYQRDTAGNVGVLNARLAWELLPLSFVYVVFTDTRAAYPAPDAPAVEQRLVLKATYTWRL